MLHIIFYNAAFIYNLTMQLNILTIEFHETNCSIQCHWQWVGVQTIHIPEVHLFVFAIVFVSDHTIAFVSIVKSIVKNAIADAFPLIGNQSSCLPQSSSSSSTYFFIMSTYFFIMSTYFLLCQLICYYVNLLFYYVNLFFYYVNLLTFS